MSCEASSIVYNLDTVKLL